MSEKINEYYILMFKRHLNSKNFKDSTINVYLQKIKHFLRYADKSANDIQENIVNDFILSLVEKKYKEKSIRLSQSALKIFFQELLKKNFKFENYKNKTRTLQIFTKQDVQEIIKAAKDLESKIIIMLLYSSGLSIDELLKLKKENVFLEKNILKIEKDNQVRYTILSNYVRDLLKNNVCEFKIIFKLEDEEFEFRKNYQKIKNILINSIEKSNIKKNYFSNILKHCFVSHLIDKDVEMDYIQKILQYSKEFDFLGCELKEEEDFLLPVFLRIKSPLDY